MGFRFRKSIKIAPGVRLNLNSKSTSLSFGGKGARYTVSSTGRKTATVGIPGTGISYSETTGGHRASGTGRKKLAAKLWGRISRSENRIHTASQRRYKGRLLHRLPDAAGRTYPVAVRPVVLALENRQAALGQKGQSRRNRCSLGGTVRHLWCLQGKPADPTAPRDRNGRNRRNRRNSRKPDTVPIC